MIISSPYSDIAKETANLLLEANCVLFSDEKPFTLTSGRKSPVYIDCRRLIGFPKICQKLMDKAEIILKPVMDEFDVIAGGETAGIPYAAFLAQRFSLPMAYIRKKPKGFGRNARIEGALEKGQNVLLVEDLATDGESKLSFIDAIRESGGKCAHCFVIFHYGIFPQSIKNLQDHHVTLHALSEWSFVLEEALQKGIIKEKTYQNIQSFFDNPNGWQAS